MGSTSRTASSLSGIKYLIGTAPTDSMGYNKNGYVLRDGPFIRSINKLRLDVKKDILLVSSGFNLFHCNIAAVIFRIHVVNVTEAASVSTPVTRHRTNNPTAEALSNSIACGLPTGFRIPLHMICETLLIKECAGTLITGYVLVTIRLSMLSEALRAF